MTVFLDTSGFYAYVCRTDRDHERVRGAIETLVNNREPLATSSYVLCESMGLIQRRMGFSLAQILVAQMLPLVEVLWLGQREHEAGWAIMKQKRRRKLSIVDATSIALMREHRIRRCVAVDPEFSRAGFEVLP